MSITKLCMKAEVARVFSCLGLECPVRPQNPKGQSPDVILPLKFSIVSHPVFTHSETVKTYKMS